MCGAQNVQGDLGKIVCVFGGVHGSGRCVAPIFVMHGSDGRAARLVVVHGLVGTLSTVWGRDTRIGCTWAKLYGYD